MNGTPATGRSDVAEVEYQFDCPDLTQVERWLQSQPSNGLLSFVLRPRVELRDTYLDTEDWSVFRAHFALRARHWDGGGEWTLKALADFEGPLKSRREINQAFAGDGGLEALLAADGPVSERIRLLCGSRLPRALFDVATSRLPFAVQQEETTLAVLTLDDTHISVGSASAARRRVEIEQERDGGLEQMQAFITALVDQTHLTVAKLSKFEMGLEAAGMSPPAQAGSPGLK